MSVYIPYRKGRAVFVGTYSITSPSGKVYIGQSWSILTRWRAYQYQNGIQRQRKLCHSLQKYGPSAHQFKILDWFSAGCTQEDLDRREQYWIDFYRASGVELLNLREGGSRGKPSLESIRKGVATRHANGSYAASKELRLKRSAHFLGKKQSPSTIAKRIASKKGQRRPDLALRNTHRVRTEEEKLKQSIARKEWWEKNKDKPRNKPRKYTRSTENCRQISEIKKQYWAAKRAEREASQCVLF